MRKLILSFLVVAVASIVTRAQEIPDRKREESKPIIKEKIFNKKERANLDLTDEQKEKLKSMTRDLRGKMEELRKKNDVAAKEFREKMEELRKEQQTQFQSILTPDQKDRMEKYKEASKAKFKEFGLKKQSKLKERLDLNDEQVAKIAENRKAISEKIRAIRENNALMDDQKREEIKELMKKQKESMKSILTEEQMKKMKENRKDHMKKRKVVI